MDEDDTGSNFNLFDTPSSKLLDALPADLEKVVERLFNSPIVSDECLRVKVEEHLNEVREAALTMEFIDVEKAALLATHCHRLIETLSSTTDEEVKRVIHAAISYFVQREDGEDDFSSPIGFDDDEIVIQSVVRILDK